MALLQTAAKYDAAITRDRDVGLFDRIDAILMDVDNGPEALVRQENNWLYSSAGLKATRAALRPRGVLARLVCFSRNLPFAG